MVPEQTQSALSPNAPAAEAIATLGWVMFAGAAVITVLVLGLIAYAMLTPPGRPRWLVGNGIVVGGGIVLPVVVLTALLVWSLWTTRVITADQTPSLRIAIVGEQWWWRVVYLDEAGRPDFATANEMRIPVGEPVELILTSADVIHSFWVPPLGGKLDMIPGHVNRLQLVADEPGVFRGQCAEYCGGAHALMAFHAVALPPEDYAAWRQAQARPAPEPADPFLQRGRALFLDSGCGSCHTVRGTPADGVIGPDLTHVGGRVALGAGILANNQGTLAGWTANPAHIKPGVKMPAFNLVSGADLRAIAAWLESLR